MANYEINGTKLIVLLLLVAAAFFFIGNVTGKLAAQAAKPSAPAALATPQNPVEQILGDASITDPQNVYSPEYKTSLLYTHTLAGEILGFNQTELRIDTNNRSITVPLTTDVAFMEATSAGNVEATSRSLKVGRFAIVVNMVEAGTYKYAGTIITIAG